jgi:tRNA(Ile)-lysidine synthase
LALGRAEVLGYLERRGLSYRIDSTNADIRYLRNRIRHKLIPLLDEWFPRWKKSLLLMAETQGLCAEFLEEAAGNLIPWEEAGPPGSFRTEKAAFFAAPAIIREEALLRGADLLAAGKRAGDRAFMPDAAPRAPRPPRRGAIRRFVRGGASSADLGPLRLEGRGDFLTVSASGAFRGEAGFSLLIKEPGIYKLEGLRFRVSAPEAGAFPGAEGFYARLPLVLRPRRREDRIFHPEGGRSGGARDQGGAITAEDSGGAAAFIGPGKAGVLVRREGDRGGNGGGMFFFTVSAGDTGERMGDSDV